MRSIVESVDSFLEREGIDHQRADDPSVLTFSLTSNNGSFSGCVAANEEEGVVRVHICVPPKAPTAKRCAMAELLARINERVALGGFQLDMDDGEISYKTSAILGESELHDDIMKNLFRANWWAINTFFPAINMVLFGNSTPRHAVNTVLRACQSSIADESDSTTARNEGPREISRESIN